MRRCIEEGLVGGEGFAVDASLVRADVSQQAAPSIATSNCRKKVLASAVREYLAVLDDAAFGGATPVAPKQRGGGRPCRAMDRRDA